MMNEELTALTKRVAALERAVLGLLGHIELIGPHLLAERTDRADPATSGAINTLLTGAITQAKAQAKAIRQAPPL